MRAPPRVGTRSPGKTREIHELFTGLPFELAFPADQFLEPLPDEADLERAASYAENAVAKARYFATRGGLPTYSRKESIPTSTATAGSSTTGSGNRPAWATT